MVAANRDNTRSLPQALPSGSLPIVILIAALIVGVAALLPLVQNSLATSTGGSISRLEQDREDWQAQVHEQEIAVAELGSLDRIDREARVRLKMMEPTSAEYIAVDAAPPAAHKLPSRYLPPDEGATNGNSSIFDKLLGWIPFP